MIPIWLQNLPWNIFDTLINFVELLVIFVPAIAAFVYFIRQTVAIWVQDATDNGATIVIHNKTNKSVFITDIQFQDSEYNAFKAPVVTWNNGVQQLKPDDYIEVVINYRKTVYVRQSFKVVVEYNRTKKKKVKVTV